MKVDGIQPYTLSWPKLGYLVPRFVKNSLVILKSLMPPTIDHPRLTKGTGLYLSLLAFPTKGSTIDDSTNQIGSSWNLHFTIMTLMVLS